MAYYGEEMAYEGDLLGGVPELFEDPFAKQFGPEVPQPLWTLAEARDRLRGMPGVKVRAPPALRPRRLRVDLPAVGRGRPPPPPPPRPAPPPVVGAGSEACQRLTGYMARLAVTPLPSPGRCRRWCGATATGPPTRRSGRPTSSTSSSSWRRRCVPEQRARGPEGGSGGGARRERARERKAEGWGACRGRAQRPQVADASQLVFYLRSSC